MGQYYKPINLDTQEYLVSFDYDNGLKLMEHSYVGNYFVGEIMILLMNEWNGHKIIWGGDYADDAEFEFFNENHTKLEPNNLKNFVLESIINTHVFVNYDKKTYCKINCCDVDIKGWQVNPIPLLLANLNGRGGGDYRLDNEMVGSWAYDKVGIIKLDDVPNNFKHDTSINFLMDM